MPDRDHLRRLAHIWVPNPIFFLTVCTRNRRRVLARQPMAGLLLESWQAARRLHGWIVGRHVIMPDHVHFFTQSDAGTKSLSAFIRDWKKWTTRAAAATAGIKPPLWQPEFFDHVLRTSGSYEEKWAYVRENPARAGLVTATEEWPYAGEGERLSF